MRSARTDWARSRDRISLEFALEAKCYASAIVGEPMLGTLDLIPAHARSGHRMADCRVSECREANSCLCRVS